MADFTCSKYTNVTLNIKIEINENSKQTKMLELKVRIVRMFQGLYRSNHDM